MNVDYDIAMEVASHEGLVTEAYKDSVGVWTWSIGLTNATGHDVTRYIKKPQTIEHCLKIYAWALEKYVREVVAAFAPMKLNKHQLAAATSFHYNTGAIARATWVKEFKAGKVSQARKSIMNWSTPKEIIPRRGKERDLFFDGKWSNNGTTTQYTKVGANGNIVWSSAKRVNIKKEMEAALAARTPLESTEKPADGHKDSQATDGKENIFIVLLRLLIKLLTGGR